MTELLIVILSLTHRITKSDAALNIFEACLTRKLATYCLLSERLLLVSNNLPEHHTRTSALGD